MREWLATKGLHGGSSEAELANYLPDRIVIRGRPALIQGPAGKFRQQDIMDGYNVFAVAFFNATTRLDDDDDDKKKKNAFGETVDDDSIMEPNGTTAKDYSSSFQLVIDSKC